MATASATPAGAPDEKGIRRVAVASYIGTTIEWYDYFIYGTAAALVFPQLFFPGESSVAGTLAAFGAFAVGFIARPLGGIIMGNFGDRVGRKSMLVISLMMMGIATTAIGLLPSFETIGVAAPILLFVLRIVQGFGVGGEWGGAVLMAVEHAPRRKRTLYGSFPQLGVPSGIFVSNLVFVPLNTWLTQEQFAGWGWRIPFLLSAVLVAVGIVIRLRIEESPVFQTVKTAEKRAKLPIVEVLRQNPVRVALGSIASMASPTLGYLASVYLLSYATDQLGVANSTMLWAIVGSSVVWFLVTLFSGMLGDRLGRKPVFLVGAAFAAVWAFPLFWLVETRTFGLIFLGIALAVSAGSIMAGPQAALLAGMFKSHIRYSGASLAYQISSIVGGGLTPLLATWLYATYNSSNAISVYLVGLSIVSFLAMLLLSQGVLRSGDEDDTQLVAAGDERSGSRHSS